MRTIRHSLGSRRAALAAVCLSLVIASCDAPQAPAPGNEAFAGRFDAGQRAMEFQLGSTPGPFRLVVDRIEMEPSTSQVHVWVAIRNAGTQVMPGPTGVNVSHFIPNDIEPLNAACTTACPTLACQICTFDHRDTYGDDGMLEAGETSIPVEWILRNPSGDSFAFQARIHGDGPPADGVITGAVFRDANANGRRENTEAGIGGVPVTLHAPSGVMIVEQTNPQGQFQFQVTDTGLYEVVRACPPCLEQPFLCRLTTPDRYQVLIVRRADGTLSSFGHADFGCAGDIQPISSRVEGILFDDSNRNGIQDRGEVGIANVRIVAQSHRCPDRAPVETRTDMRGYYTLMLPDCGWLVERDPVPGYQGTTPNPVWIGPRGSDPEPPPVPGDPSRPPYRVDFGVTIGIDPMPRFAIEGVVFLDMNQDGVRDANEAGIGGVSVSASSLVCEIPALAQAETDRAGRYRIDGSQVPCPLPWEVGAFTPLRPTTPLPVRLDAPPADGRTYHVDFGFAPADSVAEGVRVHGTVYFDMNSNGIRDRDEPGVPNAEVTLLTPLRILIATRTGRDGGYAFPPHHQVLGVWQSQPEFPRRTTPNPVHFDPPGGGRERRVDFGIGIERRVP